MAPLRVYPDPGSPGYYRRMALLAAIPAILGIMLFCAGQVMEKLQSSSVGSEYICGQPACTPNQLTAFNESQTSQPEGDPNAVAEILTFLGGTLFLAGVITALSAGFNLGRIRRSVLDYQYGEMRQNMGVGSYTIPTATPPLINPAAALATNFAAGYCPGCGAATEAGDAFCRKCGHALTP